MVLKNRKELVRERLINAAIKVIGIKGFRKSTVPVIAKKAGIGTGTFYLYFRDKSHIFAEAIIYVSTRLRNYIDEVFQKKLESFKGRITDPNNTGPILRSMCSAFFDYVDIYRNHFVILFIEGYSHKEEFASILWETYRGFAEDMRIRLMTASQLQIIRSLNREEAEIIAWAIIGALPQVAQFYITGTHDRKRIINVLVDFMLQGIKKETKEITKRRSKN